LGQGGKIASNYASFVVNMWKGASTNYNPVKLKNAVAQANTIFSGFNQQDAHEFLTFLVDGIHEDLNRVLKKPDIKTVDGNDRKDSEMALESWISYTARNQSIIVDLMTGQFKSKVTCL
jgi:ubiquitin C-terminal hydrolase